MSATPARGQLVLATHNQHKVVELRRMLDASGLDLEVLSLDQVAPYPEPAETEATFEGNARLKAEACLARTGLPSVADDSGLAVDVLNGMPGVRSARWSGPGATDQDNNALLLRQLADVEADRRGARFVCAMAFVRPGQPAQVREGVMTGRLLTELRGRNGFGYDPMFLPDGQTRTYAELTAAAKDAISHRGQALRQLLSVLDVALSLR